MSRVPSIRILGAEEAAARVDALAAILIDCVEGGASVSFMAPLDPARARAFWLQVAAGVARGERILLVAEAEDGRLLGTVQLVLAAQENQPHRADLAKLLVCREARRQGLGAALLAAAEETALAAGRWLLVLDTVTGSAADRLYTRAGWTRVGEVPDYALWPEGGLCPTTFFCRDLRRGRAGSGHLDLEQGCVLLRAEDVGLARAARGGEPADRELDRLRRLEGAVMGEPLARDPVERADPLGRKRPGCADPLEGGPVAEDHVEGQVIHARVLRADRGGELAQAGHQRPSPPRPSMTR